MSPIILPFVALLLVGSAARRYRPDLRALIAGVGAALAATLAASLVIADINYRMPYWLVLTVGGVVIVVGVGGTIYAESRLRRFGVKPAR